MYVPLVIIYQDDNALYREGRVYHTKLANISIQSVIGKQLVENCMMHKKMKKNEMCQNRSFWNIP